MNDFNEKLLEPLSSLAGVSTAIFMAIKILPEDLDLNLPTAVPSFLGFTTLVSLVVLIISYVRLVAQESDVFNKITLWVIILGVFILLMAYILLAKPEMSEVLSTKFEQISQFFEP